MCYTGQFYNIENCPHSSGGLSHYKSFGKSPYIREAMKSKHPINFPFPAFRIILSHMYI